MSNHRRGNQIREPHRSAVTHNALIDKTLMRSAMRAELLDAEHEFDLARRWRDEGDEQALHELTTAYMRLVISIAGRFKAYGLPLADLVQEGGVGLMQAAARFEPERGVRFSTYATWWIRSSIQDYVLRNWSIVRAGATVAHKSLFFSMRRLRAQIDDFDERMSPETRRWIAEELNVREIDVEHMSARLSASDRSLNAPMQSDGDAEWSDMLADERPTPEATAMSAHDGEIRENLLAEALKILNPRELHVVAARRLTDEGETLQSIGERIGVSKERVRQIEKAALDKLRQELDRLTGGDARRFGLIP